MDEIEKLEINAEAALEFDDTTHVVALSYARDVLRRFLTDREALQKRIRKLETVAEAVRKAANRDVDNLFKYAIQINDDIRLPKEMWWSIVDALADVETQHEQIKDPAN